VAGALHVRAAQLVGLAGAGVQRACRWRRARSCDGRRRTRRRSAGCAACAARVGLAYDLAGSVVLDPDRAVQQAVALLFQSFARTGSARAVVQEFAREGLQFPAAARPAQGRAGLGRAAQALVVLGLLEGDVAGVGALDQRGPPPGCRAASCPRPAAASCRSRCQAAVGSEFVEVAGVIEAILVADQRARSPRPARRPSRARRRAGAARTDARQTRCSRSPDAAWSGAHTGPPDAPQLHDLNSHAQDHNPGLTLTTSMRGAPETPVPPRGTKTSRRATAGAQGALPASVLPGSARG